MALDLISFQATALFEGWDNPLVRLLQPDDEDDGQAARRLLASALAAVENAVTADAGRPELTMASPSREPLARSWTIYLLINT